MVLSILSVVAILGFASAVSLADITSYNIPSSVDQSAGTFDITFDLTNNGVAGTLTYNNSVLTSEASISFNDTSIGDGSVSSVTERIKATVTFPTTKTGSISGLINVTGTGMSTFKTLAFSVPINPTPAVSCEYNNSNNNLRIKKIEFTNNGFSGVGFGKDDEWFPLDKIEVEIQISNRGDEKIEDIELEWGIYDPSSDQWVFDFDDEDEFDLKAGKTNTITLSLSLDDADLDLEDLNDGNYEFWVKATGYDTDYEENICVSSLKDIKIIVEDDFVVLNNILFSEGVSCGDSVFITADVWNVGDEDQEDVYVIIYNKDLKIYEKVIIGDVDAFDSEKMDARVTIPKDALEGNYIITLSVYDEDDDVYENDYDDDKSVYSHTLKVGACEGTDGIITKAVVSANLISGGKAGQDMIIRSTITNLEDKSMIYTVGAAGYSEWASSASVDTSTFALGAGESNSVLLTFKVKDTAEGENFFNIELYTDGKLVSSQPVSVSIDKKGFSFPQLGENKYLWGIALVNIILILVIIIVAIKVLRK